MLQQVHYEHPRLFRSTPVSVKAVSATHRQVWSLTAALGVVCKLLERQVQILQPLLVLLLCFQVAPARVGEAHPALVHAEVVIDTRGMRGDVASGWDELKQHDVLFMLAGER
eukprot:GHUV01058537.1.p1 GENE.GHUV01058537.1~~GHUV01058537.1.p1  ORF type:complete len:112 (-),score=24.31 GHUV01058537.1:120-455(-)